MLNSEYSATAPSTTAPPESLVARLARFFVRHEGEWVNARDLFFAGSMAWRSRVSNLRKRPYFMTIENRVYLEEVSPGRFVKVSEYRFVRSSSPSPEVQ